MLHGFEKTKHKLNLNSNTKNGPISFGWKISNYFHFLKVFKRQDSSTLR